MLSSVSVSEAASVLSSASPPRCQVESLGTLSSNDTGPDIITCQCDELNRDYVGNLNFLKHVIGSISSSKRNIEIMLTSCGSIEIEINVAELTYKQTDIRIENTSTVIVNTIRVVSIDNNKQYLALKNVANFYLTGRIYCSGCTEQQGPLHLEFENVEHTTLEDVNSTVPIKITARHLSSVSLYRTYLSSLPWPGLFVYNTTRVSIQYSILPDLLPKTISMTLGNSVDVSYNIMDVASSLNIQQYSNMNEQCNRENQQEELSYDCKRALNERDLRLPFGMVNAIRLPPPVYEKEESEADPSLYIVEDDSFNFDFSDFNITEYAYILDYMFDLRNDTIAVTTFVHNGVYGAVFLTLCILFIIIFSLIYCCCKLCSCKKKKQTPEEVFLERQLSSHLTAVNKVRFGYEADEYSNSSKAHLAQGIEAGNAHVQRLPAEVCPSLRYVTVQKMQADAGEDGVICGSLTLQAAPRTAANDNSLRDVSSNKLKAQAFNKA